MADFAVIHMLVPIDGKKRKGLIVMPIMQCKDKEGKLRI